MTKNSRHLAELPWRFLTHHVSRIIQHISLHESDKLFTSSISMNHSDLFAPCVQQLHI